MTVLDVWPKC